MTRVRKPTTRDAWEHMQFLHDDAVIGYRHTVTREKTCLECGPPLMLDEGEPLVGDIEVLTAGNQEPPYTSCDHCGDLLLEIAACIDLAEEVQP